MRPPSRETVGLGPPSPGCGDFWATLHVKFTVPVPDSDDPMEAPAQGYYRNFGVRCLPSRVAILLEQAVADGVIDWADSEWHLVEPSGLDRELRAYFNPVVGEGLWYKSGRVLYADPDLEPGPSSRGLRNE